MNFMHHLVTRTDHKHRIVPETSRNFSGSHNNSATFRKSPVSHFLYSNKKSHPCCSRMAIVLFPLRFDYPQGGTFLLNMVLFRPKPDSA